jgi:hypothetical protein
MDVYQRVLVKINEMTGGRDNVDTDMVDLLKKEGFYQNIDDILEKLSQEGWVTETRPRTVRITHWGTMAARKIQAKEPDSANILDKQATRLQNEVKELMILAEQFNGKSTPENFGQIEKKLADVGATVKKIKDHL